MSKLVVSTPPHLKTKRTTKRIMIDVVIALLPAAIVGVLFFGLNALLLIALSCLSCVLTEYVYVIIRDKAWKNKSVFSSFWKQFDFTSLVTGLLLAMVIPASVPWYYPVLGGIFAIAVAKMVFGGTGKNIVNPAIVGRIFLFISFAAMTVYPTPEGFFHPFFTPGAENGILTGATPLTNLLANPDAAVTGRNLLDLLFGFGVGGCIGETCKVALLIGYLYLVLRGVIKFWWPLLYIGVTGIVAVCLGGFDFTLFLPSILSGGLILGACFMATDYVTSPKSNLANVVYYILLGVITAVLRKATGIEVVSFAILLMNILVPLLDLWIPRRPFGYHRSRKEATK